MRLLVIYRCGGTLNDCLKAREKWYGLSCASSANDDSEMSSARCPSTYCINLFCCQLGSPPRMRDTRGETLSFMREHTNPNDEVSSSHSLRLQASPARGSLASRWSRRRPGSRHGSSAKRQCASSS